MKLMYVNAITKMVIEVCKWWWQQEGNESKIELELDFEIIFVELGRSLLWHVMCRTVQTLDYLRFLYTRDSFSKLLTDVFNRLCRSEDSEPSKLRVEWTTENYEKCRCFFTHSNGRPFGNPLEWIKSINRELPRRAETTVNYTTH